MPETGDLRVSEAVPLAHALVARMAELEDIRILFVKGPTAVALGARPPRPSSDVDVMCEPGSMDRLGKALQSCAWHRRVPEFQRNRFKHASIYMFEHSVHYIHDEWPCDLDVHYNFPGFLAPDDIVFEALWSRRATTVIANMPVPCADMLGQAAIVGLHALRDPQAVQSTTDIAFLTRRLSCMGQPELADLRSLAAQTGSSETLGPLLERVGVPSTRGPWSDPELLRRWTARTQNAGIRTTPWLIELKHTAWFRRPALVWRALFLSHEELLSHHIDVHPTRINAARLQAKRWGNAVRHLRRGLQAARSSDRGLS